MLNSLYDKIQTVQVSKSSTPAGGARLPRQSLLQQRLSPEVAQHNMDAADKIIFSGQKQRPGAGKKTSPMLSPGRVRSGSC